MVIIIYNDLDLSGKREVQAVVAKVDIQPVEWVEKKVNVRIAQMPTSLRSRERDCHHCCCFCCCCWRKRVATFGQKPDVGEVSGIFVLACLNPNQTGGGQWDVNQPLEKSMLTYINNVLTAHDLRLSGLVF